MKGFDHEFINAVVFIKKNLSENPKDSDKSNLIIREFAVIFIHLSGQITNLI